MASTQRSVIKFKTTQVARQQGELARLRVLRGPDQGSVYVIFHARVTIGRGEECPVMISDLKASRLHAELVLTNGGWQVRDLGSANGILLNQQQTRAGQVRSADVFVVGETVMEFLGAEASSQALMAQIQDTRMIQSQIVLGNGRQERARSLIDPFGLSSASTSTQVSAPKSVPGVRLLLIASVGVFVVLMLSDGSQKPKDARKPAALQGAGSGQTDFESLLPKLQSSPKNKSAEMFFKQGFREFRSGNYFRARAQFDLVLQILPEHDMARRYRENCNRAIEDEVRVVLDLGRKTFETGRLREAKGHFESVIRLLSADQSNPAYQEARDQLTKVNREMEAGD